MYGGTEWRKYPSLIRFLFWYYFRVVWCSPGRVRSDKIPGVVLYVLFCKCLQILVVFGIFCNAWAWLEWLGKNRRCVWALTCGRKEHFDCHLFCLIVCVRRLFFLYCVGFRRCNACCNVMLVAISIQVKHKSNWFIKTRSKNLLYTKRQSRRIEKRHRIIWKKI